MRDAMARAEVGDDVYGEDPTVNALEAHAAGLLGFEAALFVASGTQANLCALLAHCGRGDEYIAGHSAHTYRYEGGGAAALGGIQPQPVPFEPDGTLDLGIVAGVVKPDDDHFARTRLLCLENTQGGKPLPHRLPGPRPRLLRRPRACPAPRRRAALQCRRGVRGAGGGHRRLCGFRLLLPLEGIGGTGRIAPRRCTGLRAARAALAQGARWRHAPSRHPRRRRTVRVGTPRRAPAGGSSSGIAARGWAGRHFRRYPRARRWLPYEHGLRRPRTVVPGGCTARAGHSYRGRALGRASRHRRHGCGARA